VPDVRPSDCSCASCRSPDEERTAAGRPPFREEGDHRHGNRHDEAQGRNRRPVLEHGRGGKVVRVDCAAGGRERLGGRPRYGAHEDPPDAARDDRDRREDRIACDLSTPAGRRAVLLPHPQSELRVGQQAIDVAAVAFDERFQ
jgi:hypothetical protein